jgi:hypothetical protein
LSELAVYLFGDNDPGIAALIRDPGFRGLIPPLFSNVEAAIPAVPPPSLEPAVRGRLLTVEDGVYRAGPRLTAIPAGAERELPDLLRPALAHYVEIAGDVAAELRPIYEQTSAGQRFDWSQVSHTLIAGVFLDLAMGVELYRSGRVLHQLVGETTVWAFEGVSAENAFGVQLNTGGERRLAFVQLWHRRARLTRIQIRSALVDRLAQVARGEAVDRNSKELLYLRHVKLVRTAGSSLQVQVPVFGPHDTARLLPLLVQGARRLVEDAIVPSLDLLREQPWWKEKAGRDGHRHAAVRLILEYGIDRVIASKVLDPFPAGGDPPVEWGRWLWEEQEGPLTLIPQIVVGQISGPLS